MAHSLVMHPLVMHALDMHRVRFLVNQFFPAPATACAPFVVRMPT